MNNIKDENTQMKTESDDIGRLIRHVGERETVPAERLERSRQKVLGHWEEVVREEQRAKSTPRLITLARVAGIAAVAAVAMMLIGQAIAPAPEVTLAMVERTTGDVMLDGEPIAEGQPITAESELLTAPGGRVALRMASGQSLRIDQQSAVSFNASDYLSLESGAIYIDTEGGSGTGQVQVETPMGIARDIGTQFQVRLTNSVLLVGVRDGLVEVDQPGQERHEVNAGFQVAFTSGSETETRALDTESPDWRWIENVAPPFSMDGASLADYLVWYAGESGLKIVWADDDSQRQASRTTLTGDLENTSVADSLEVVRRIAPFDYRVEGRQLWVEVD